MAENAFNKIDKIDEAIVSVLKHLNKDASLSDISRIRQWVETLNLLIAVKERLRND